jgi:hypothetical protein
MWVRRTDDELSRERRTPMWAHALGWTLRLLYALACCIRGNPAAFNVNLDPRTVICNKCHRVKMPDAEHTCGCGGMFEDIRDWKWVDESATLS